MTMQGANDGAVHLGLRRRNNTSGADQKKPLYFIQMWTQKTNFTCVKSQNMQK